MTPPLLLLALSRESRRKLAQIAFIEQEPKHMLLDDGMSIRVGRGDLVLVDDRDETLQPLLPALGGDVVVNALSQIARVWGLFQAFGFLFQDRAVYHSSHGASR